MPVQRGRVPEVLITEELSINRAAEDEDEDEGEDVVEEREGSKWGGDVICETDAGIDIDEENIGAAGADCDDGVGRGDSRGILVGDGGGIDKGSSEHGDTYDDGDNGEEDKEETERDKIESDDTEVPVVADSTTGDKVCLPVLVLGRKDAERDVERGSDTDADLGTGEE